MMFRKNARSQQKTPVHQQRLFVTYADPEDPTNDEPDDSEINFDDIREDLPEPEDNNAEDIDTPSVSESIEETTEDSIEIPENIETSEVIAEEVEPEPEPAPVKEPKASQPLFQMNWEKINAIAALKQERDTLGAQNTSLQQELASLKHNYLSIQTESAAEQAELLAKVAQEKKNTEAKITTLKEEIASARQLSLSRIKELEERNKALEGQLVEAHEDLKAQTNELVNAQATIQTLTDNANKKGSQQALQLFDAQHKQDDLRKTIHAKDMELAEAKEKQQELLEKYNAALARIGEIITKIQKARQQMQAISAEFETYIKPDETKVEEPQPEPVQKVQEPEPMQDIPTPNLETVEILGKPISDTPAPKEKEKTSSGFWHRIASLF